MAKHFKGVGSFVVIAVVVYLLVRYWTNIKAAIAPAVAQVTGTASATVPATNTNSTVSAMLPVQPSNANDLFGGPQFTGGVPVPLSGAGNGLFAVSAPGGNVGGLQTDNTAAGSPFVYVDTTGKGGKCSTHLWDRKPLCSGYGL